MTFLLALLLLGQDGTPAIVHSDDVRFEGRYLGYSEEDDRPRFAVRSRGEVKLIWVPAQFPVRVIPEGATLDDVRVGARVSVDNHGFPTVLQVIDNFDRVYDAFDEAREAGPDALSDRQRSALVGLASRKYRTRMAAQRMARGDIPVLAVGMGSKDVEVRSTCKRLWDAIVLGE